MKTHVQLIKVVLPVIILLWSNFLHGQSGHVKIDFKSDHYKEYIINLKRYFKNAAGAKNEDSLFRTNLRYGNGKKKLGDTVLEISMWRLVKWFDSFPRKGNTKISAVKIRFGLEGDKVIPLFQFISLNQKGNSHHKYNIDTDKVCYTYSSSGGFINAKVQDTKSLQTYIDSIRICHCEGDKEFKSPESGKKFDSIINNTNNPGEWINDSRAIIFSFQEIFALYNTIFPGEFDANRYSKNIYIHNGVARYCRVTHIFSMRRTRYRNKHTMFISGSKAITAYENTVKRSRRNKKKYALGADNGEAANLAHLSPPNEKEITYK